MAWKDIPEKKVLATLEDRKKFKGVAAEKMTIYVDGGVPGGDGDVQGISVTVDPSTYVMTTQLKDSEGGNVGDPATVDLPLESMVVSGEYDDATKSVILTLKNGETVSFSVADLVAGLQTEITSENPLSADLIEETSNKNFVTEQDKENIEDIPNLQNDINNIVGIVDELELEFGEARTLTEDDYNWNSETHSATEPYDSIAPWLLAPGIYYVPRETYITISRDSEKSWATEFRGSTVVIANGDVQNTSPSAIVMNYQGVCSKLWWSSNGILQNNFTAGTFLTKTDIHNGLNSTSTERALAANQGKVLNEKIGDLSSLDTTEKSNLVGAINEVAEGGSGGGGVLTLYMLDPFNSYLPEVGDHLEFCRDKELTDPITATELDAALNEGKMVQINCLYNAGDDWGPNYITITDFYDDGSYGSYMSFTLRSSNSDAGYRVEFRGDNDYATVVEKQTYNVQADWNEAYDTSSAFIKNKPTIPSKVSDLTNDAGYQNASQVSSAIAGAVGDITSFEYQVVQALPVTGEKGVIYLVANSGTTPNIYDEYIWVNNTFEKIGTTDIDLSGYATTQDLEDGLAGKVDAIDPTYLPSGAEQGGIIYVTDHTDIDPDSISNGQIIFDQNDGTLYIAEVTVDAETGENIVTWHEIQTEKEVIYANMTVTDVQTMTFTVSGYTANDICVLLDAGVNVIYRLNLAQSLPGLAAGIYDFRPIMHASSGGYGGVMSSMVGPSGNNTILGIASHVDNGTSSFEMRYLQNKIDSDHKLSADLIDSSSSDDKTYQTGTGAPTTSTEGSVGEMYVDKSTGKVYVCTSTTGGTYTWAEVSGTQVNSDWNASSGVARILNKPSLATVATTGAYSDLTGTPTIPTVNNATLTIQKNGTTVQTFTANASSNKTANIEVPVITMQTTDPGEGVSLAANNFIAVYEA